MPLSGADSPQDATQPPLLPWGLSEPARAFWGTPAGRRRFWWRSWLPWTWEARWRLKAFEWFELAHHVAGDPPPNGHRSVRAYLEALGIDRNPLALLDLLERTLALLDGLMVARRAGAAGADLDAILAEWST